MKKTRLSNRLLLVAIVGICSWGCQRTSGESPGTGATDRAGRAATVVCSPQPFCLEARLAAMERNRSCSQS